MLNKIKWKNQSDPGPDYFLSCLTFQVHYLIVVKTGKMPEGLFCVFSNILPGIWAASHQTLSLGSPTMSNTNRAYFEPLKKAIFSLEVSI